MAELDNKTMLPTESQIKKSGFNNFMSRLFGWTRSTRGNGSDVKFVQVDLDSKQRVGQSLLGNLPNLSGKSSDKLESLYRYWLSDTTDKYDEIINRRERIDQLAFMVLNDPYAGRTVDLYADEATQLDEQNTIISIETPDLNMTKYMYNLINTWGLTPNRVRATIKQLGTYGDAFWSNKVTDKGVEAIKPLQQMQVTDRMEFSPIKALEIKKRREGAFSNANTNNYLIDQMFDSLETNGDIADMFDTKLFGFQLDGDLVVPPWLITHFRVNADGSEFYPFGESPIIGALSSYKQVQSTITLQSIARMMSFPVTVYSVKTSESMDEGRQFGVVNRVRESYDNIGVTPNAGTSESYTVNTKIWVPENLLKIETHKTDMNLDDIDDLALYQNREAMALGLPKSFFGEEGYYSGSASGKSLTRQYKPFARKVFSIQSAFLEGLADLFRIHFAITGDYDFRVPFTLSMKYPAVEEDDDYQNARQKSIDVATDVVKLVKDAIGAEEDEGLPPDIVRDIIAKYTFLDPVDIMKWTRDAKFYSAVSIDSEGNRDRRSSDDDFNVDLGEDLRGTDDGFDLSSDSDFSVGESTEIEMPSEDFDGESEITVEKTLRDFEDKLEEYASSRKLSEKQRLREKELVSRYNTNKGRIYFETLKENAIGCFTRHSEHVQVFNTMNRVNEVMLNTLSNNGGKKERHFHEKSEKYSEWFDTENQG